jgi:hypothetical protein
MLTVGSITDNYAKTTFFPSGAYTYATTPIKTQGDDNLIYTEYLFNVIVVDTNKEILLDTKVVASNSDNAKFISRLYEILKEEDLTLDDVTVITNSIGSVKVKKEE